MFGVNNEGSLPPEQAKEMKIQMLHRFYKTSTLEELVLAQDHQIEKLQAKLLPQRSLADQVFPNPRQG